LPRGMPDYGMYAAKEVISPIADVGELAARLGSIVSYDRRGDVIWLDDFEGSVLRWRTTASGTGAAVTLDTSRSLSGVQSVKLTTGNLTGNFASVARYLSYPRGGTVGLECAFASSNSFQRWHLYIKYADGTKEYWGELQIDAWTGTGWYTPSAGPRMSLGLSPTLFMRDTLFHHMKLVVDLEKLEYLRAMVDNTEVNLSGEGLYSPGTATDAWLDIEIRLETGTDANLDGWVDDAIITINEP